MYEISAISSFDDETYDTFLDLFKEKFNVPLKQTNNKQKSTLVRFWRNCDQVSLKVGEVCYDGKPVLRKSVCCIGHCSESI